MESRWWSAHWASLSRRGFIRWCGAPLLAGMTTRLRPDMVRAAAEQGPPGGCSEAWADFRLTPHYRAQFALDRVLSQTRPGHDVFTAEVYAEEVAAVLAGWSAALGRNPPFFRPIIELLSPGLVATPLQPVTETCVRHRTGLQVWKGRFDAPSTRSREAFVKDFSAYFAGLGRLPTAALEVAGITVKQESPLLFSTRIRYDLVGLLSSGEREERVGSWDLDWG